jgi:hypothetical protein
VLGNANARSPSWKLTHPKVRALITNAQAAIQAGLESLIYKDPPAERDAIADALTSYVYWRTPGIR